MKRWLVTAQRMPYDMDLHSGPTRVRWFVEVADESDTPLAAVSTAARQASEELLAGGDDRSTR